jgi:hypothetical protein
MTGSGGRAGLWPGGGTACPARRRSPSRSRLVLAVGYRRCFAGAFGFFGGRPAT